MHTVTIKGLSHRSTQLAKRVKLRSISRTACIDLSLIRCIGSGSYNASYVLVLSKIHIDQQLSNKIVTINQVLTKIQLLIL